MTTIHFDTMDQEFFFDEEPMDEAYQAWLVQKDHEAYLAWKAQKLEDDPEASVEQEDYANELVAEYEARHGI